MCIVLDDQDGGSETEVLARLCAAPDIKELIASRPEEVNLQGLWGNTPAILAAQYAREDILLVLMESGADVSVANEAGATPLLFASMEGFVPATIKRILALGAPADPAPARVYNTRTDSHARLTPLLAAATNGNLEAVRVLLEAGVQKDRAVLATITFTEHQDASDPMCVSRHDKTCSLSCSRLGH